MRARARIGRACPCPLCEPARCTIVRIELELSLAATVLAEPDAPERCRGNEARALARFAVSRYSAADRALSEAQPPQRGRCGQSAETGVAESAHRDPWNCCLIFEAVYFRVFSPHFMCSVKYTALVPRPTNPTRPTRTHGTIGTRTPHATHHQCRLQRNNVQGVSSSQQSAPVEMHTLAPRRLRGLLASLTRQTLGPAPSSRQFGLHTKSRT